MRSALLLITITHILCASLIAQPDTLVLSERIGPTVEPHERAYFGLFPWIEGFEAAVFLTESVDTVTARVRRHRPTAEVTTYKLAFDEYESVRWFIARYDSIRYYTNDYIYPDRRERGKAFLIPRWPSEIMGSDFRYGYRMVRVLTADGYQHDGILLYITTDVLILGPREFDYSQVPAVDALRIVHTEDIALFSITLPTDARDEIQIGLLSGFLAGYIFVLREASEPNSAGTYDEASLHLGAAMVGLLGGGIGAGIGYLVASTSDNIRTYKRGIDIPFAPKTRDTLRPFSYYKNGLPPELYRKVYK
ncbi:MAG: hypothetical protein CL946_00240 [Ectothiorhodospiraceae bacterium]|nr:hypothetical protein [Ectothiorhodospiraceae bacterium]